MDDQSTGSDRRGIDRDAETLAAPEGATDVDVRGHSREKTISGLEPTIMAATTAAKEARMAVRGSRSAMALSSTSGTTKNSVASAKPQNAAASTSHMRAW